MQDGGDERVPTGSNAVVSTHGTSVSVVASLSTIPYAPGGAAQRTLSSFSSPSAAPRRRRMTLTEVTSHAVEWTGASVDDGDHHESAASTFASPESGSPPGRHVVARRRSSVRICRTTDDDDSEVHASASSSIARWSSAVECAFTSVVVRSAQRCYARVAEGSLHGTLTRDEIDALLVAAYERYHIRVSQANLGVFNLFTICTGGGRFVSPIGDVLADMDAVARSSLSTVLSMPRLQRQPDPVSERDAFEFVELGPSPTVVVLLWKSRKSCKLFMRAVRGVNLALRCCLCPSNIRGLLVTCVLELRDETMATVVWLPPLASADPIRASSSAFSTSASSPQAAGDPVSHVLLCLHEFLLHGHRYEVSAPSVDLYCAADGSLVAVPGKQLIDALACSRPLTKFVDALLRPCLPSLSSPVHRALSSLKQLVQDGFDSADRRTLLRDTLHSTGCRMVQLLELRDFLADACTRDTFTTWSRKIIGGTGGEGGNAASLELAEVFWRRFTDLHALMLAEAIGRTLKNFILSRYARRNSSLEGEQCEISGVECSTSCSLPSDGATDSASFSLGTERSLLFADEEDDVGAASSVFATSSTSSSTSPTTLGDLAARVFFRFSKSKNFFTRQLLPAMSFKFRATESRGRLLDPATISRRDVRAFLQHRLGLPESVFGEGASREEHRRSGRGSVAAAVSGSGSGRRSRPASVVSLASSMATSIASLSATSPRPSNSVPSRGLTKQPFTTVAAGSCENTAVKQISPRDVRDQEISATASASSVTAAPRRRSGSSSGVASGNRDRFHAVSDFLVLSSSVRPLPSRSSTSTSREVIAMAEAAFGFLTVSASSATVASGGGAGERAPSGEFSSESFRSACFLMTCYWSLSAMLRDFKSGISVVLSCTDPRSVKRQRMFLFAKATLRGVFCILEDVAPNTASNLTCSRLAAASLRGGGGGGRGAGVGSSASASSACGTTAGSSVVAGASSLDADVFECQQFQSTLPVFPEAGAMRSTVGEENDVSGRFGFALWTLWMARAADRGGLPSTKSFMLTLAWALMEEQPTYRAVGESVREHHLAQVRSKQNGISSDASTDLNMLTHDATAARATATTSPLFALLLGSHFASTSLLEYFLAQVERACLQQPSQKSPRMELSVLLASAVAICALVPVAQTRRDGTKGTVSSAESAVDPNAGKSTVQRKSLRFIAEQLCTDTRWYPLMSSSSSASLARRVRRAVLDVALRCYGGDAALEACGIVLLLLVAPTTYPNWVRKCCADAVMERAVAAADRRSDKRRGQAQDSADVDLCDHLPQLPSSSSLPSAVADLCRSPSLFWSVPFPMAIATTTDGYTSIGTFESPQGAANNSDLRGNDVAWDTLSSEVDRQVLLRLRRAAIASWQGLVEAEGISHIRHPSVRGLAYLPECLPQEPIRCLCCFPRPPDEAEDIRTLRSAKTTSQVIRHERNIVVEGPVPPTRTEFFSLPSGRGSNGRRPYEGNSLASAKGSTADAHRRRSSVAALVLHSEQPNLEANAVSSDAPEQPQKFIAQLAPAIMDSKDTVLPRKHAAAKPNSTDGDKSAHSHHLRAPPLHHSAAPVPRAPPLVDIPFPPSRRDGGRLPRLAKFVAQLKHDGTATSLFAPLEDQPQHYSTFTLEKSASCSVDCDGNEGLPDSSVPLSANATAATVKVCTDGFKYIGQLGNVQANALDQSVTGARRKVREKQQT